MRSKERKRKEGRGKGEREEGREEGEGGREEGREGGGRVLVVHKSGKRCEVVLGTRLLTSQNYC